MLRAEYHQVYFPGDDLFAALRPRSLAIGSLTSQFWANVMLHDLDMFVAHELRAATPTCATATTSSSLPTMRRRR